VLLTRALPWLYRALNWMVSKWKIKGLLSFQHFAWWKISWPVLH